MKTLFFTVHGLYSEKHQKSFSLTRRYQFYDDSSFLENFWYAVHEFFDDEIEDEVGYEQSVYRQLMELGFTEYENEDEEVEGSIRELFPRDYVITGVAQIYNQIEILWTT